jgi:hypothetical protein
MVSTRDDLNNRIAALYNAINSFQATVNLTPSVGSVYTNSITEIKDVRAYILFRKPDQIRIQGQLPVVRTRAFDMVADGANFKVFLATPVVQKNLFVEGSNSAPPTSKNKLENLRPEAFLASMLIRPAEADEHPSMVDLTDEDNALYLLFFNRILPGSDVRQTRAVFFDRIDLSIVRQVVWDDSSAIVSDTRYSKWQPYNGVMFPAHIDINRPKDGYGVVLDLTDMKMNVPLTDQQFVLDRPEGSQLQVIGSTPGSTGTPIP